MITRAYSRLQEFMLPVTGGIKSIRMDSLVYDAKRLDVTLGDWDRDPGAGTMWDLLTVCMLARHLKPKVCFEIGTGHGRTTHHLALNTAAETKVFTLDISSDEVTGCIFRNQPTASKISCLVADSTKFDFSPYKGKADLIVVDGDHSYEGVVRDTERALEMMSPAGCILWDDFAPTWPGVIKALKEHRLAGEFRRIAGTKWVVHCPSARLS